MELLTPQDVKRILKVSLPWVYKAANQGRIPCIRWECPGSGMRAKTMLRFRLEDVQEFIRRNYRPLTT
jgi:hypothetical protein